MSSPADSATAALTLAADLSPSAVPAGVPESGLAQLHPAYFAMVMATGIVSLASFILGHGVIARVLLALNLIFYPTLWVLTLARLYRYPARVVADFTHHGRAVAFFTMVPATSVLGSQCLIVGGAYRPAVVLWTAAIALWFLLTYSILTVLTVKRVKPPLDEGLNGGWLLAVVATQSVAVLGAQLAPFMTSDRREMTILFALAMWLGGGMLYIWIIGLIFYRYTFFPMSPSDLAPPYWINMGAAAISTLAGANLMRAAPHAPLVQQVLPFVRGLTLMWWATATWWIPMLISLSIWRHFIRRFPLRYDPLYWGAVFPLGMYAAATARLSATVEVPFLMPIPRVTIWVALTVWMLVAVGLARSLFARARAWRARRQAFVALS